MGSHLTLAAMIGGVPFLDPSFRPGALLAAVAVVRARAAHGDGAESLPGDALRALLRPSVALELRVTQGLARRIPNAPLSEARAAQVEVAMARLATLPSWRPLLELPLAVRGLVDHPATSCSCYGVPQHIFLSESAFDDAVGLEEYVLHEVCHNWMYCIEEIRVLHPAEFPGRYTLPTGTAGRNPTEVIGAAHVASTLIRWYRHQNGQPERVRDLSRYLAGCIELLEGMPPGALTATGIEVAERLANERVIG